MSKFSRKHPSRLEQFDGDGGPVVGPALAGVKNDGPEDAAEGGVVGAGATEVPKREGSTLGTIDTGSIPESIDDGAIEETARLGAATRTGAVEVTDMLGIVEDTTAEGTSTLSTNEGPADVA